MRQLVIVLFINERYLLSALLCVSEIMSIASPGSTVLYSAIIGSTAHLRFRAHPASKQ